MRAADEPTEFQQLQAVATDAHQSYDRVRRYLSDARVIGHAEDIWTEARRAVSDYARLHPPSAKAVNAAPAAGFPQILFEEPLAGPPAQ